MVILQQYFYGFFSFFVCFTVYYKVPEHVLIWFAFKIKKTKNNIDVQIPCNLQNHHTYLSEKGLANLARSRECFVGLSSY